MEDTRTLLQHTINENQKFKDEFSKMKKVFEDSLKKNAPIPFRNIGSLGQQTTRYLSDVDMIDLSDNYLRNPNFDPFVMNQKDPKNVREILDNEDPLLIILKEKYGQYITDDIIRAVKELKEFNPSGRYPFVIPWNHKERRQMEWHEVIQHLVDVSLKKN